MKTFLKIFLFLSVAVVLVKLLPALLVVGGLGVGGLLVVGCLLVAVVGCLAAAGLSVVAIAAAVAVVLGVALSPIWVPIAVVVGIVALLRKKTRTTV